MNAYQLKFWQPVKPNPDIAAKNSDSRKGSAARHRPTDISPFAAVVQQDPTCPKVYRDPHHFFNATYLTAELKQLFKEVLGGLCGEGQRIFALEKSGDVSQTFLALYHLTKYRPELQQFPQFLTLPNPQLVQVAGLTTFDLEIKSGMEIKPGLRIFTPWGYLAWQLGGSFAYSLVKIHDEQRVAPSQYLLRQLMGINPKLLLVEDFIDYVQNAIAILGIDDPFIPEILIFIENLIAVVEKSANIVLVYSLPATETNLLTAVKTLINPSLMPSCRGEAYSPTGMASLTGQESLAKNQQFPPRMLRPHAHNIGKNRKFSPRMLLLWQKSSNPAKITAKVKPEKQAIAVVCLLDENPDYSRLVYSPKHRRKIRKTKWEYPGDIALSKQICFPDKFSTLFKKFLLSKTNPGVEKPGFCGGYVGAGLKPARNVFSAKETRFLGSREAIARKETRFLWWICRGGFKNRPYCFQRKRNQVSGVIPGVEKPEPKL